MKNWISKARARLCSQAGESIGETLASLLVAALALTMLAGAMTTAGNVVTQSRDKLDSYYDKANSVVQKMSGLEIDGNKVTIANGTVTITDTDNSSTYNGETHQIKLYSNREQFGGIQVAAYKRSDS